MTTAELGSHLYTLCQCPVCEARFALAPVSHEVYYVWRAAYPAGNPIAIYAASDRMCFDCLFKGEHHEMTITVLVAALTESGRWLDLTMSATNQLVRG